MVSSHSTPEISVILPAFNAESTIEAQLEALAAQNVSFAWELLVSDNGSTDNTCIIVERWRDRLPRLTVVDASRRRGVSAARNIGAEHAVAPVIVFCDADDIVGVGWLERMHAALRTSVAVAGSAETGLLNSPLRHSVSWPPGDIITEPYWPHFPAAAGRNLGVQLAFFNRIGGFDEGLLAGEDIDFCWRVQAAGGDLTWCMDAIIHVRKRVGLRAVYRQAFGYALGDKLLKHKWSAAISDYWRAHDQTRAAEPVESVPVERSAPRRSHFRRAARLTRPDGRADLAWVVGSWAGAHFSRIDASLPRLDSLPH
jgi:glycosyltransferase involved in cell wall biosynthesis